MSLRVDRIGKVKGAADRQYKDQNSTKVLEYELAQQTRPQIILKVTQQRRQERRKQLADCQTTDTVLI